jgi:DHA2 family methylenomycin A resistance protein-like MFS transporter
MMTGCAILPLMIMVAFSSYLSGKIVSKIGPKLAMAGGLLAGTMGFLGMLIAKKHAPAYWEFILPFVITGFGIAFTMPAATVAIMSAVGESRRGIASGAFNTSRQIGSLIGVAIFGTIVTTASSFMVGMHITLFIAALVFFLSFFATLFLL